MKKQEFFDALRRALSGLPMDERDNVMQYYEDYFLDAEGESEEEIIRGLGDPQKIADDILREYRELQPRPGAADAQASPRRRRGISPWLLLVLVLLAIPIGVPLAGVVLIALPAALLAIGAALIVFSFLLWGAPASAVMTLGGGLTCLSLGGLAALLFLKLCRLFVPPLFRGLVAVLRWPIDKLRGVIR